jgi:integration host factor subunit beta
VGTLGKADIIDAVYHKVSLERGKIAVVVDLFLAELKMSLVSNNEIKLRGFGTFELRTRKGREKARNPKSGEALSYPSHKAVVFKPSGDLKKGVLSL